jgi:hypothetical protein
MLVPGPGTLIIYFVTSLTILTLFFLGIFSCWVFFLPLGRTEGFLAGIEPGGCHTAAHRANHLLMLHPGAAEKE